MEDGSRAALADLRERLRDLQGRRGLSVNELVAKCRTNGTPVGRTVVSQALNHGNPCPSWRTVAAIAQALGVKGDPLEDIHELLNRAEGASAADSASTAIGREELLTVTEAGPVALEVHHAVLPDPDPGGYSYLTPYLSRPHDDTLRSHLVAALAGDSSLLVMMVGDSSTGKTRALYEALSDMAADRALVRPSTAADLLSLLHHECDATFPAAVLWLNEAQRFLYDETAAAALRNLLVTRQGIVAVGTLWTDPYWERLVRPGVAEDRHGQARALLDSAVTRMVVVPDRLEQSEMVRWQNLASREGDSRLVDALAAGTSDGRVVQHLSGGPALLAAYLRTPGPLGHFRHEEHALLTAALEARRLGHSSPIPAALLAHAADAALDSRHRPADAAWAEVALTALSTGKRSDGRRIDIRNTLTPLIALRARSGGQTCYEPADYLDQKMRTLRAEQRGTPSLWQAALAHATEPADLHALGLRALNLGLFKLGVQLLRKSLLLGSSNAAHSLFTSLGRATDPRGNRFLWTARHMTVTDPRSAAYALEQLRRIEQAAAVAILAERAAAETSLTDSAGIARLLKELRWSEQNDAVTALLTRGPADTAGLSDLEGVARLLQQLREIGHERAIITLTERVLTSADCIGPYQLWSMPTSTTPPGVAALIEELRKAGQDAAVAVVAERAATGAALDDPGGVSWLLWTLGRSGQHQAITTLAERMSADFTVTQRDDLSPLESRLEPGLSELLKVLRLVRQNSVAAALASRVAAEIDISNTPLLADAFRVLKEAGQKKAVAALAERAAAHTNLNDPAAVIYLLDTLRFTGPKRVHLALAKRAAGHTSFADPSVMLRLLRTLRGVKQGPALTTITQRVATRTDVTDPSSVPEVQAELLFHLQQEPAAECLLERAVEESSLKDPFGADDLLRILREPKEESLLTTLALRAATEAMVNDPAAVNKLLGTLWILKQERASEVLAERAATAASLNDPSGVARLIGTMRWARQGPALAILAERAATAVGVNDPAGVAELLGELWRLRRERSVGALAVRTATGSGATCPADLRRLRLRVMRFRPGVGHGRQWAMSLQQRLSFATPAERKAYRTSIGVSVTYPAGLSRLYVKLWRRQQRHMVATLAERATMETSVNDPAAIGRLLGELWWLRLWRSAAALAERAAMNVSLTDQAGLRKLLEILRWAEQDVAVVALFERAATAVDVSDPVAVANLLHTFVEELGQGEAVVSTLAGDAARHASLSDSGGVTQLLMELRRSAQHEAAAVLAERAAIGVSRNDGPGVSQLLKSLKEGGPAPAAQLLQQRLMDAGYAGRYPPSSPYGRELDGTAAAAWTWDQLPEKQTGELGALGEQ
ncbi:helix-turn-helix domain-containing protein [Streptomyces bottropensis]|uniref:helix-turn-helix domain-containing protein n=1 Tax=Streptomyces bottropensis TaxID=42235 RepID=UPI00378803A5